MGTKVLKTTEPVTRTTISPNFQWQPKLEFFLNDENLLNLFFVPTIATILVVPISKPTANCLFSILSCGKKSSLDRYPGSDYPKNYPENNE